MQRIFHRFLSVFITCLSLLLVNCDSSKNKYSIIEHPPEIRQAISNARSKSKGVIIIFGADWCPPCRQLDRMLENAVVENELSPLFEIVKVDIGNWDKNINIAKKYGNPVRYGIPGIVLLNKDGSIKKVIEYEEISSLLNGGSEVLSLYLSES